MLDSVVYRTDRQTLSTARFFRAGQLATALSGSSACTAQMQTTATGVLTFCAMSVGHTHEPCKNGCTDRDAIWGVDSDGPKNHVLGGDPGNGQFGVSSPLKSNPFSALT